MHFPIETNGGTSSLTNSVQVYIISLSLIHFEKSLRKFAVRLVNRCKNLSFLHVIKRF